MKPVSGLRFVASLVVFLCLAVTSRANLLAHGDFNEPDNELWSESGWLTWGVGASGRPQWADRAGSGRGAAAYGWTAGGELGFYQDIPATAGIVYAFSVWVKREANYREDTTEIKLEWRDSGLADLGGSVVTNTRGQVGSVYTRYVIAGRSTNPACAFVRPAVYSKWLAPTNADQLTMQFDDASLDVETGTLIKIAGVTPLIGIAAFLSRARRSTTCAK